MDTADGFEAVREASGVVRREVVSLAFPFRKRDLIRSFIFFLSGLVVCSSMRCKKVMSCTDTTAHRMGSERWGGM